MIDTLSSLRRRCAGAAHRRHAWRCTWSRAARWCGRVLANTLEVGAPPGYILRGLVVGSLYALSAIGIVLVFRANRVINFAQAELGSVAAVIAIELVVQSEVNYFVAIGIGLVVAALLGALIDVAVIRRFRKAPRLILTVATIGIAQILAGVALIIPLVWEGANAGRFITPFTASFTVSDIRFDANNIVVLVVAPARHVRRSPRLLRRTDYGIGVRAAAENEDRANLLGIPVRRLSTMVWALASMLSATAVLLRVPLVGFASFQGVSGASNGLLLRVLAAAVIGRMENLPRTVVAAISIGIFDELASAEYSNTTYVDALLVVVILLVAAHPARRVRPLGRDGHLVVPRRARGAAHSRRAAAPTRGRVGIARAAHGRCSPSPSRCRCGCRAASSRRRPTSSFTRSSPCRSLC